MPDAESMKQEAAGMPSGLSVFAQPDWLQGRRALAEFSQLHSHALTRAIANVLLPVSRQDWPQGRSALVRLSNMLSGSMMRAIAGKLLYVRHPLDWHQSRHAMACVFGFDLPHHFFHTVPVNWVQLTEPQATKAFAGFLNAEDGAVRSRRVQAFLRALGSGRGEANAVIRTPRAKAEAPAGKQRRIDLLLEWQDAAGFDRGAVVEAKFGHHITTGQLSTYRKLLRKKERRFRETESASQEKALLFVVSSRRTSHDDNRLAKNRHWRWISWRSLLLAYERALEPGDDDDDFRQFRRTLWDRAGS